MTNHTKDRVSRAIASGMRAAFFKRWKNSKAESLAMQTAGLAETGNSTVIDDAKPEPKRERLLIFNEAGTEYSFNLKRLREPGVSVDGIRERAASAVAAILTSGVPKP